MDIDFIVGRKSSILLSKVHIAHWMLHWKKNSSKSRFWLILPFPIWFVFATRVSILATRKWYRACISPRKINTKNETERQKSNLKRSLFWWLQLNCKILFNNMILIIIRKYKINFFSNLKISRMWLYRC
jgi:hypothetical protein